METNYKARHSIPLRDPSANLHVSHYQLIIAGRKIGTSSSKKWKNITGDFNLLSLLLYFSHDTMILYFEFRKCSDMYHEVEFNLKQKLQSYLTQIKLYHLENHYSDVGGDQEVVKSSEELRKKLLGYSSSLLDVLSSGHSLTYGMWFHAHSRHKSSYLLERGPEETKTRCKEAL